MSLRLYMDAHIPAGITSRLRFRGVDVITAQEDGTDELADDLLLERAASLERALFTHDEDFHRETSARLRGNHPFFCVFFAVEDRDRIVLYADWLEAYATLLEPDEVRGRLIHIP